MGAGAEIAQQWVSWLGYRLHFFFRKKMEWEVPEVRIGSYEMDTRVML